MAGLDDLFAQIPVQDIASKLGADQGEVDNAIKTLVPALVGGLAQNVQSDDIDSSKLESAVATQDCSVPGISSRDVAKWEPIPVALSAEEAIHWFKALQMLRRCDGSSITTKRTK